MYFQILLQLVVLPNQNKMRICCGISYFSHKATVEIGLMINTTLFSKLLIYCRSSVGADDLTNIE